MTFFQGLLHVIHATDEAELDNNQATVLSSKPIHDRHLDKSDMNRFDFNDGSIAHSPKLQLKRSQPYQNLVDCRIEGQTKLWPVRVLGRSLGLGKLAPEVELEWEDSH